MHYDLVESTKLDLCVCVCRFGSGIRARPFARSRLLFSPTVQNSLPWKKKEVARWNLAGIRHELVGSLVESVA
jgi:hypothetical protein